MIVVLVAVVGGDVVGGVGVGVVVGVGVTSFLLPSATAVAGERLSPDRDDNQAWQLAVAKDSEEKKKKTKSSEMKVAFVSNVFERIYQSCLQNLTLVHMKGPAVGPCKITQELSKYQMLFR